MGPVVDLERVKVEQLAVKLVPELRDRGQVVARAAELESVERWRRAARRAGRILGWRMLTRVSPDGEVLWAGSDDWPVPPGEVEAAMERLSWAIYGPPWGRHR